jgi:hypothetical protein
VPSLATITSALTASATLNSTAEAAQTLTSMVSSLVPEPTFVTLTRSQQGKGEAPVTAESTSTAEAISVTQPLSIATSTVAATSSMVMAAASSVAPAVASKQEDKVVMLNPMTKALMISFIALGE